MTAGQPIIGFARDVVGFEPWPRQAQLLDEFYAGDVRVGILRLGRRSGKGRTAALVAVYEATANAATHLEAVPEGEQVLIAIISRSTGQARKVLGYIKLMLRAPTLRGLVARTTQDELELTNGIVIRVMPCHAASVRGDGAAVAILDEAAHWVGRSGSPLEASEIWSAVAPATAQFPAGRLLILSTPRLASGWFYEQCQLAAADKLPGWRHWHATTQEMNPKLAGSAFLAAERERDPVAYRREYGAEFTAAIAAAFDSELVRAAVDGRKSPTLPPVPGVRYVLTADPAYVGDRWTALVGHAETNGRIVVDRVLAWQGSRGKPVQHDPTLDELAALATAYNGAPVIIDQYAAQPIRQGLRQRGLTVHERPWTNESKVDAVAALRRALYAERLAIPDHRELVTELSLLEQRATPGGRPRFAAPGGAHDDYATALMALVAELSKPRGVRVLGLGGRITYEDPEVVAARRAARYDPIHGWLD